VRPPYVLIGHSIGGLYQGGCALLYPRDVKALVLIDPTHPDQWIRLQREAGSASSALRGMRAMFHADDEGKVDARSDYLERTRVRSNSNATLGPHPILVVRTRGIPINGRKSAV